MKKEAQMIKYAMERQGINRKRLSELSGVRYHTTCKVIRGEGKPPIKTLSKLCQVLNLPVADVITAPIFEKSERQDEIPPVALASIRLINNKGKHVPAQAEWETYLMLKHYCK